MQKALIIIGAVILAVGLLWPWISKLGFGRLPGDIAIKGDGFWGYIPLTTMILISIVVTVLFRLFGK
jgi:hypothetical protein